jgi:hypothetical protein
MLRIRTVRGTHVRITLQVVTTKTTLLGKGTKRTRVVHAIVLYQQGLRGLCGWPWACHGAPADSATSRARPVPVRLAVSVETVLDSAPQTAFVTIYPSKSCESRVTVEQ